MAEDRVARVRGRNPWIACLLVAVAVFLLLDASGIMGLPSLVTIPFAFVAFMAGRWEGRRG